MTHPPHPSLAVLGFSEAAMFLRRSPPPSLAAILSIHGRREFPVPSPDPDPANPPAPPTPRLDLAFDDVLVPAPGDDLARLRADARRRWAQQNNLTEVAPTPADARAIITFARVVQPLPGVLLCHCGAGISRAPAAALVCLATWRGPGSEPACLAQLLTLRPAAVPHPGLVRFADALLDRNGALTTALAAARGH